METERLIRTLLSNRGLRKPKEISAFFNPPDPTTFSASDFGLKEENLFKAADLARSHIFQKHPIAVYGDYDVDGICSAAILWETIHSHYPDVFPYIPHRREEGYGLSVTGINTCLERGAKLIIALDCGITARSAVSHARKSGCDVIIIDHHKKEGTLPRANCLIHSKDSCSAGLVWLFSRQLAEPELSRDHLSLVALAVVCDMVPLLGINRSLVKHGLTVLNSTTRPGLLALFETAGIKAGQIGTYEIGFIIGPRLNAMGRLEHALDSLRLLCGRSPEKTKALAQMLEETNRNRQDLTESSFNHALRFITEKYKSKLPRLLIVAEGSYDEGVIGLIASRLTDKFSRPSLIFSLGENISKASARSVPGIDITNFLRTGADFLKNVGGHSMAAGLTADTVKVQSFISFLQKTAPRHIPEKLLVKKHHVDARIPLEIISPGLLSRLTEFAPFGIGNPQPIFSTPSVSVTNIRRMGKLNQHLRFHVGNFPAVHFNYSGPEISGDKPANLIYRIELNTWNNRTSLQLNVRELELIKT
jgi:single-stranded-DNA-specific exonuclease